MKQFIEFLTSLDINEKFSNNERADIFNGILLDDEDMIEKTLVTILESEPDNDLDKLLSLLPKRRFDRSYTILC